MKRKIFIGKRYFMVFAITFTETYAHHSGIYEFGKTYLFETNVKDWDNEENTHQEIISDLNTFFNVETQSVKLPILPPAIMGGREATPCIHIQERRSLWISQK